MRLACLLSLWLGASAGALADTTLHVSPEGKDRWAGALPSPNAMRADGPLASLAGARDRIRALRRAGRLQGAATVLFHKGTYRLEAPVLFAPEDSGTGAAPITYAAALGEEVVFSGGRPVTGWKQQGERWVASLPEVAEGKWYPRQLFVNGERRRRARTPNEGFLQVQGMVENPYDPNKPRDQAKPSTFVYRGEDIRPEWADQHDVEVILLQGWAEARMEVCAVDPAAHTVTLAGAVSPHSRVPDARYWVENAPECLDAPGEWYLDRKSATLTYWPLPGEEIGKVEVTAPVLTQLVRLQGDAGRGQTVQNLTFRGFTFRDVDWGLYDHTQVAGLPDAIGSPADSGSASCTLGKGHVNVQAAFDVPAAFAADGAVGCTVERCRFERIGNWAVELGRGCQDSRVERCEMVGLGAGGVKIGDPMQRASAAEQTCRNTVSNCRIHDIGIVYPGAVGIWIGQSYENTVAHNEVFDTCYTGISVGWTWGYGPTLARGNVVEQNHVHHICRRWLSSVGGIYTLGVQPGTVIRGNVVHDLESSDGNGWGLYFDIGSGQITAENNLAYRTDGGSFLLETGRENVLRNNVLAFARSMQLYRNAEEEHSSFTFERNIVLFNQGGLLGNNWANDRFTMDHNLYWDMRQQPPQFAQWTLEQWQAKGHDANSLVADPLFTDPMQDDFTLKPDSPALKLGFQPLDVSKVGPLPAPK